MSKPEARSGRRQPRLGRGLSSLMTGPVQVTPPADGSESIERSGFATESTPVDAGKSAHGSVATEGLVYLEIDSITTTPYDPKGNIHM